MAVDGGADKHTRTATRALPSGSMSSKGASNWFKDPLTCAESRLGNQERRRPGQAAQSRGPTSPTHTRTRGLGREEGRCQPTEPAKTTKPGAEFVQEEHSRTNHQ